MKNLLLITIKIVLIAFLIIIIIRFIPAFLRPFLVKLGLFGKLDPFKTSEEHMKRLGIKIVQLPPKDEQNIHSMIKKTIKAGYYYYNTEEEKEFEAIKHLFLPKEYERVKNSIERGYKSKSEFLKWCEIPNALPDIKFSQLRRYKDLENRVGIMVLLDFDFPAIDFLDGSCGVKLFYIFIFKEVNGERKIEKIKGLLTTHLEIEEQILVEELFKEIKGE